MKIYIANVNYRRMDIDGRGFAISQFAFRTRQAAVLDIPRLKQAVLEVNDFTRPNPNSLRGRVVEVELED